MPSLHAAQTSDFEAQADVRAYVLAEAIPSGMSNVEGETDGGDVVLGWRLAKDRTGTILHVPDMFNAIFNDTGTAFPDFGGRPTVLAIVYSRRIVHDKPPSGQDDKDAKAGIPTFFIGSRGRDVWEIGRTGGTISVRLVSETGGGPWEKFQSDPTKYHYYGQHIFDGYTAEQNFADPEVAALTLGACAGDKIEIANALRRKADPNAKGRNGDTPLFWALDCGDLDGLEVLLKAGADPNYKLPGKAYTPPTGWGDPLPLRTRRYSVTYAAALKNDLAALKLILRYGGDPNSFEDDERRKTALTCAFGRALSSEYVHHDPHAWDEYYLLLGADKNINFSSPYIGETIAEQAAMLERYDKVEELLHRGYTYKLEELGGIVENVINAASNPVQMAARARIIEFLKRKGVKFPTSSPVRSAR
jgi:uncharacterized protein